MGTVKFLVGAGLVLLRRKRSASIAIVHPHGVLHARCGFGWTGGADGHGVLRVEARCVIADAEVPAEIEGRAGKATVAWVGHRHHRRA